MEQKQASKRPVDSSFRQQRLRAWQPLLTPLWVIGAFVLIGIVFIPLGVVILNASNNVVELRRRYDTDTCLVGSNCTITIEVTADMDPPIYAYYALDNFFQNHRRYVKSRSDAQLRGDLGADSGDCDPLSTNGADIIVPCGLIANSVFNDTFTMNVNGGAELTGRDWNGVGIAWRSDREDKFRAEPLTAGFTNVGADGVVLPPVDNEDFIVWMRTAGLPSFKKLYRKIEDLSLKKGDMLTVNIENNYDVSPFDGKKSFVLSTTSWLGGKNSFLGYAYVVTGGLCLLLAITFQIKHIVSPRRLGSMEFFHWSSAGGEQEA